MEAVGSERRFEGRGRFGRPGFHHREAGKDRNALGGADVGDDRDIRLEAREILDAEVELWVDEHDRHPPGLRRGDAGGKVGAKSVEVDADDGVVGADLPNDQVGRILGEKGKQTLEGRVAGFAADAGVDYVRLDAPVILQPRLELGGVGGVGARRADALGRGRADRQDAQRSAVGGFIEARLGAVLGKGGRCGRRAGLRPAGARRQRVKANRDNRCENQRAAVWGAPRSELPHSNQLARKNKTPIEASV